MTTDTPKADAIAHFGFDRDTYICRMTDFARELERELTAALAEGLEQARLLGKSGEREAGLLARIEALKRELATLKGDPRITMPDPLEHN